MGQHNERFLALVADAKKRIQELTVDELRSVINSNHSLSLIDVREASEWERAAIPGAVHLSKGVLEAKIEQLIPELDTEIILYCGGGYRSALAADNLQKMGYREVRSLIGGFRVWRESQ